MLFGLQLRNLHSIRRKLTGMLAGGCAVGAGVTGGSIFALTAWLTLAAMWAAAGLTDLVVDRLPNARATQMQAPQAF